MTKETRKRVPGLRPTIVLAVAGGMCGLPAMAAVGGLRAVERSNTQISIEYVAPDSGPCRVEVSESPSYSPLVHDVDATLFAGANLDTRPGVYNASGDRTFIIGTRAVATASDGRLYSRALQQLTQHYIRVGCGAGFSDQATVTATTGYPTFSRSVRDPMLADANHLSLWPDFSLTDRTEVVIEPMTGARIKHFGMPFDAVRIYNNINFSSCANLTSGWTIGSSCTAASGTPTTFASSSCSVACGWLQISDLVLGSSLPPSEEQESNEASINSLLLHLTGQCSGANMSTADCTTQVCWSWDGTTCAGPMIDLVFPTTSGVVSVCSKNGSSTCITGDLLGADYRGYLHQTLGTGYLSTSGTSTTVSTSSSADCNVLKVGDTLVVTNASLSVVNLTVSSVAGCPTSVTVSSAVNLDASAYTGSPGFPFYYYDSFYNNPRWSLLIRKKSLTANNTLSITAPAFNVTLGGFSSSTSAGYNEFCSQFLDSNGFRKCRMTTKIYAYQPTTGEVRYLGQFFGTGGGNGMTSGQQCTQTGDGSTFWIDANSFYCTAPQFSDGKFRIWKVAFTGNTANDVENLPAAGQNTSFVAGVTVTDMTGDVLTATHTFDSTFNSSLTGNVGMCGFSGGRYVHFFVEAGAQDTLAWAVVYDVNNGLPAGGGGNGSVIAAWKTWASPSAARWGVNHACFWIAPTDGAAASANLMGMDLKRGRDDTAGGPLYHLTLAQNITASTTTFNITSTTPVGIQPPTTLQAVLPGDVFVCGGDGGEAMQITVVNSPASITVTRAFGRSTAMAFSNGADCWMTPYFNQADINQINSGEFWDFLSEPHGPSNSHLYMSYCPGGGHAFYYSKWQAGSPNIAGNFIAAGIENSLASFPLCSPASFSQDLAKPNFSSVALAPFSSAHEGHPGFKPTPFPLMLDNHPNIGEGLALDSGLTLVTGTLFRLTYTETNAYADGDDVSLKFLPRLVTSQKRIFSDVSGPASSLGGTLADGFKYCIVVRANECRSGSTAGQIYVNAPYLNPAYYTNAFGVVCWLNSQVTDDLCFEDDGQRAETVSGYVLPSTGATVTDPNTSFPVLEQFGMLPKGAPNTNNTKLMWGNWGYGASYILPPYSTSYRLLSYFVKVPDSPPPFDSANRTAFQPEAVQIPSVPTGTNDVVVDFGYVEYGAPTDFYCTSRREKCMAVQATINSANPFQFPAEGTGGVETGVAGVPCTVSCTVTIPVIPGYTVYFQIRYRDVNHVTLSTQQEAPRIVSNSQGSVQVR